MTGTRLAGGRWAWMATAVIWTATVLVIVRGASDTIGDACVSASALFTLGALYWTGNATGPRREAFVAIFRTSSPVFHQAAWAAPSPSPDRTVTSARVVTGAPTAAPDPVPHDGAVTDDGAVPHDGAVTDDVAVTDGGVVPPDHVTPRVDGELLSDGALLADVAPCEDTEHHVAAAADDAEHNNDPWETAAAGTGAPLGTGYVMFEQVQLPLAHAASQDGCGGTVAAWAYDDHLDELLAAPLVAEEPETVEAVLAELVKEEAALLDAVLVPVVAEGAVARGVAASRQPRNEPCACRSGRKYKRCCGQWPGMS